MSCPGCEYDVKISNLQRASALQKAITYAQQNNITVALYQDPVTKEYGHVSITYAQHAGYPIVQIVSPHFRPAAG